MSEPTFSARYWPAGSTITMVNVTWDSAYKDIVQFSDVDARDSYLETLPRASMPSARMSYITPGESVVIPCPLTQAERFNYLFVDNPSYTVSDDIDSFYAAPRRYCYFINGVSWVSPATCRVSLQLDVWTTWSPFMRFRRAFVAQGHAAIANTNLWNGSDLAQITPAKMRRYLATPEPVDSGGEFEPAYTSWTDMTLPRGEDQNTYVGLMCSVDLREDWGSATNPQIKTATGSMQDGILAGVMVVYMRPHDFLDLLDDMRDAPWVSRNIMQIWLAPGIFSDMTQVGDIRGHAVYQVDSDAPHEISVETKDILTPLSNAYALGGGSTVVVPKLLTAPFAAVELSNFDGSPLLLKPQQANSLTQLEIVARGMITAPWDRIAVYPKYYGAGDLIGEIAYAYQPIEGGAAQGRLSRGENLAAALWFNNFPRFAFTSDGYLAWLAQGTHSREWSYQSANWSKNKGEVMNQAGYMLGQQQRDLEERQNRENYETWQGQMIPRSLMSASDAISVDVGATIGDLGKLAANTLMEVQNQEIARNQFVERNQLAGQQADFNLRLANQILQGDYNQAIASLIATQRDAEITPPSVVGASGGNGWNFAMGLLGYRLMVKVPARGQRLILMKYFQRFGYTISETMDMPQDLRLMTRFTYWKLQESAIDGTITEGAKQAIRAIFERGTTVWNTPADIAGNTDVLRRNAVNTSNPFGY